jgi:hypothetical protein
MQEAAMGLLRVLGKGGDKEIPWNPEDREQLDDARFIFETLLREGYQAYSLEADGHSGEFLRRFQPEAHEIVLAPRFQGG